jgi:hypothetical protein
MAKKLMLLNLNQANKVKRPGVHAKTKTSKHKQVTKL